MLHTPHPTHPMQSRAWELCRAKITVSMLHVTDIILLLEYPEVSSHAKGWCLGILKSLACVGGVPRHYPSELTSSTGYYEYACRSRTVPFA